MRCKVGDMVRVIGPIGSKNIGACGQIVSRSYYPEEDWDVKMAGPCHGHEMPDEPDKWFPPGQLMACLDCELEPIPPDSDPEKIETVKEMEGV